MCERQLKPAKRLVTRDSEPTSRAQRQGGLWGPPTAENFAARGIESSVRQAERIGKRGCRGGSPSLRFVPCGSVPARQAERSGKRGCGGGSAYLPSASLPAVASRLQDKPSAAESGVVGAAAPTCEKNNFEGGIYSRNYPRVHERKAPGRAPAGGVAGIALGRAGVWGQRSQLLLNIGVNTNGHRLFNSVEHTTGRAPADNAAGQAPPKTTRRGCFLGATSAKRRMPDFFLYGNMVRRFMVIAECWLVPKISLSVIRALSSTP
jgi:hypothetical protein